MDQLDLLTAKKQREDYGSLAEGRLGDEDNDDINNQNDPDKASYSSLLFMNRPFRLLFVSWILTEAGEWFTYIAALTLIKRILNPQDDTLDRTAVSILIAVWLIPDILLAAVGGVLADARDRRVSMMVLNFIGAIVALFYLIAYHFESVWLIYVVSFLKQAIAALFEPCGSAIMPMLVPDGEYLKKATTLTVMSESVMDTIGAAIGGLAVAGLGVRACFLIDSLLYLVAAFLTWKVGGQWNPADEDSDDDDEEDLTVWEWWHGMATDGVRYLRSSFFGTLVLLKFSAASIYGAVDVLEVSFSERAEDDEKGEGFRLGLLFACSGMGCLLGTIIVEGYTDMKQPRSLQSACVWSFLFISLSFLGMGLFKPFASPCFFTAVDSASSMVLWIESDLLLQTFSAPRMLGRVMAVDGALATLSEAMSALLAGVLQDVYGLSAQGVSLIMAGIGAFLFLSWFVYHTRGGGAASAEAEEHLAGQRAAKR